MDLSYQTMAKPVISGLAMVGNYFNSLNRFSSTVAIAGLAAKEWVYRFPNPQSNLNPLIRICSALNIVYLEECISLPSRFSEINVRRLNAKKLGVAPPEQTALESIIEWNKGLVCVGSILCQLNQLNLINLSTWSASIGKIPQFGRINQISLVQILIIGSLSYSLLNVIHLSNEVLKETEIYSKKSWCSLCQSLVEAGFYGFLLFAPKYRLLHQPTLIRAVIIAKEFFSGIVLDFVTSK